MRKRIWPSVVLGVSLSAVALALVLTRLEWTAFLGAMSRFHWPWAILLALQYLLGFPIRGLRWRIMLRPVKRVSIFSATAVVTIGYMANNVLPLRLGEIVRADAIGRYERISRLAALSSIGAERIADGLVLLGLLVAAATFGGFGVEERTVAARVGAAAGLAFAGALLAVLAARLRPDLVLGLVERALSRTAEATRTSVSEKARSLLAGLEFIRMDRGLGLFLLLSVAVWVWEGGMFWVGLVAFGLPPSAALAYFTLVVVNFGILVPSAPGYVGIFQAGTVLAFAAFGIPEDVAFGYSLVIHAMQYLPVTVLGLILASWMGVSLRFRGR